ncbi:MAG: ABC transporter substrate-binding protein [Clostridia bacterium]|nr:ABC transporter substrate-binding protein [Clostridia bacterium]
MKKLTTLILALILATACLAPAVAQGETITLMGNATDLAKSYMTSIISQYEQATGNKIDLISIDGTNFDTIATSKFATGDIPDIFQHFNDSNMNNYDVPNNFLYLNDQPWVSDLTQGAIEYSTDGDGNLLGLPYWESSVSGCFYNKTLFAELGLEPATNQAEFDELCQALTDNGHIAICWPTNGCSWMYQFALDPIFADDGGEKLERLNRNEIKYADIPEVKQMAEWVKMAADAGWFGYSYLTDGWSDITVLLGTGEAAMMYIWDTWFYTDFDESYGYTKDDFGIMPIFMGTCDEGTYEGGNLNMLMVNKNGSKVDLALEFLNFCATSEHYNEAFAGIATVSVFNNQTANIQSTMVTEAIDSINALQRTSTANPKIIGYTQPETGSAIQELLLGNVDADGCVNLMDEYRIATAKALGIEGF